MTINVPGITAWDQARAQAAAAQIPGLMTGA
jgi:hypothetical protein